MSVKGQTFSSDFLIACVIFVLAFSILYVYWAYATLQIDETQKINEMIDKGYLVSQLWFREGIPEYWNTSDVIDLGLSNEHRFNQTKMNNLNDIGYEKNKYLMGIEIYDYYFRLLNSTNSTIYTFGIYPSNAEDVIKIKRVGILNGSIVILEAMIWK